MRKIPIILLVAGLFLAISCVSSNDNNIVNNGSINIVSVTPKALIAPSYVEPDPAVITAAVGANDFAFRLGAELLKDNDGKNFVVSPYSVWLPLAALVNAVDARYKDAVLNALGAAGITEDDINKAASRMLYDLTNAGAEGYEWYHNPLRIANAIFVDRKVTLRRDFAQVFMDYYRGSSINVDFLSQDAVDAVNRWASDNTEGLITNLIEKFDDDTVAAIANAIYFSDKWSWEFDPEKTKEDVFHAPRGDTTAHYMLREGSNQTYYEDARVQAIPLRFTGSGGLYILLPQSGAASAEALLSAMTNEYFTEIQQKSSPAEGKLLLPRFSIENDVKALKASLIALGIPLFQDDDTITGLIEEDLPLMLSEAIQKAVIKVDEKGTTAAAVTVFGIEATGMPLQPTTHFEMICDRPFVFILYDHTIEGGSQILFTGVVNQPQP